MAVPKRKKTKFRKSNKHDGLHPTLKNLIKCIKCGHLHTQNTICKVCDLKT